MDEGQPARQAPFDLRDRLQPLVELELGRRARGQHESPGQDPHARGVSRVQRAVAVEVRDVMRGMARGREALEPDDALADDVHVFLRDGCKLSPECVERGPVQPARARLELARIDEVRGPDLGHVHLEPGVLSHEHAGRSRVVEMDVREQEMLDLRQVEPALREPGLEMGDGRRRAAVEEGRPVARLEQVAADDAGCLVVEVDRRGRHPPILRAAPAEACDD